MLENEKRTQSVNYCQVRYRQNPAVPTSYVIMEVIWFSLVFLVA